jgi:hypothetical protein
MAAFVWAIIIIICPSRPCSALSRPGISPPIMLRIIMGPRSDGDGWLEEDGAFCACATLIEQASTVAALIGSNFCICCFVPSCSCTRLIRRPPACIDPGQSGSRNQGMIQWITGTRERVRPWCRIVIEMVGSSPTRMAFLTTWGHKGGIWPQWSALRSVADATMGAFRGDARSMTATAGPERMLRGRLRCNSRQTG